MIPKFDNYDTLAHQAMQVPYASKRAMLLQGADIQGVRPLWENEITQRVMVGG